VREKATTTNEILGENSTLDVTNASLTTDGKNATLVVRGWLSHLLLSGHHRPPRNVANSASVGRGPSHLHSETAHLVRVTEAGR
jgi:hypothetical protein